MILAALVVISLAQVIGLYLIARGLGPQRVTQESYYRTFQQQTQLETQSSDYGGLV